MRKFKRNQIEEAIAKASEEGESTAELRSRIKRLLDLDREWGRNRRAEKPLKANYAFYDDDRPGRGAEVWFTSYNAFAILLGVQMLRHRWPQAHVVGALRQVRPDLERQHARILKQNPIQLFDSQKVSETAKAGDLALNSTDPVLLVFSSAEAKDENNPVDAAVCRGIHAYSKFWKKVAFPGSAQTIIEITGAAWQFSDLLSKTEPRSRGRTS